MQTLGFIAVVQTHQEIGTGELKWDVDTMGLGFVDAASSLLVTR